MYNRIIDFGFCNNYLINKKIFTLTLYQIKLFFIEKSERDDTPVSIVYNRKNFQTEKEIIEIFAFISPYTDARCCITIMNQQTP